MVIYIIYIIVEPLLSTHKLLRRACDQCKTQDYYGALHEECHKWVDGRLITRSEESAARIA